MKKVIICILSIGVIISIGIVPQRILDSTNHYSVVTPEQKYYQPEINCTGVVVADEGVKIMVNSDMIIKELLAENGGWVETGQVIAITETPTREKVFLNQSIDIPTAAYSQAELAAMASQYGVTMPSDKQFTDALSSINSVSAVPQMASAPISGVITWNSAAEDRFIPGGSQLCTILGLDRYRAVVQVQPEDVQKISPGATAIITGSEIGNKKYCGQVTMIDSAVTREVTAAGYSSAISVEIAIDAPADSMRHGAGISCTIITDQPKQMLTLPYEAIHQDKSNSEYIYCLVEGTLKKRYIKTGQELDDCIEITQGIAPEDIIIAGNSEPTGGKFLLDNGISLQEE